MHHRTARAISIIGGGFVVAFAWLWVGPSSYQPCRPAPFWDDLAAWISGSLGGGETDGPAGAPAFCEVPTDFTWLVALGNVVLAVSTSVYIFTRRNDNPSPNVPVP